MAQYEKIKVRSKSGLLVTKWKDKKTGKVYSTKPNTNKATRVMPKKIVIFSLNFINLIQSLFYFACQPACVSK